jgi:hypothetical protein
MAKPIVDASGVEFAQPPFHYIVHPYEIKGMKAIDYKDWRIARVKYDQVHGNVDYHGFPVDHAFTVYDELGETLPITHQLHWTPIDARHAIDIVEHLQAQPKKRYERCTTVAHDFNIAIAYRRSFGPVYVTLMEIEKLCRKAKGSLDDVDPDEILSKLSLLRQVVQEAK